MSVGPEMSADVALLHRLADAADAVSRFHFRSEDWRKTTKEDGTPVSEVDRAVEDAIVALVQSETTDSVLGEEVGDVPGSAVDGPARRWIIDGIDGTHNYNDGRPGWGTIIALEIDGSIALGAVSAPLWGTRWWAGRGEGAWAAPIASGGGRVDLGQARRLHVGSSVTLAEASVIVIPWAGMLLGWRNEVPQLFPQPTSPRSQCFALDAVMVAEGVLDAAVILFGGVWDVAATSLIVAEAGGVFRDAWGGERFDTASGVFTNASLLGPLLDRIAQLRPEVPDRPQVAITRSVPIGSPEEQAHDPWRRFGVRQMASMSARTLVDRAPAPILAIVDERAAELSAAFVGVTTDGVVRPGLRRRDTPAVDTSAITDAALEYLASLTPAQRRQTSFAIAADQWRMWINVHMNHFRHGVMLEDLPQVARDRALDIVRATLSARGYHHARSIMRLNELLAEITGDRHAFGEWPYFMSIFGEPGSGEPWGWQLDGHHLCLNVMVFADRIVMTPSFLGAEPRRVNGGPYAGISLFEPEEALGLDLIRSFDEVQRGRAIIYPSIAPDDLPPLLQNIFDGRMQAGAFHDNLVAPYQGVPASEMTGGQRRTLRSLLGTYAGWASTGHAEVRMAEIDAHLDETWFSWYGGFDEVAPFYYRVHSPVILVEFDHHPGVAFDNEMPTRHHVHTVVRTPNGGDYGADLLREHHERFDHGSGEHHLR